MNQEKNQTIAIPLSLLQEIVNYLGARPLAETITLYGRIQAAIAAHNALAAQLAGKSESDKTDPGPAGPA